MLENKLDQKTQKKDMDLGRIALTTLGYGLVGSLAPDPDIIVPLSATIGLAASTYDEIKVKNLDLSTPAIAATIGGFVGSIFDVPELNEYLPHLTTYVGILVGGALGTYNSFRTKDNKPL